MRHLLHPKVYSDIARRAQAAYDTEVAEGTMGAKLAKIRPWVSNQPAPQDAPVSPALQQDRP